MKVIYSASRFSLTSQSLVLVRGKAPGRLQEGSRIKRVREDDLRAQMIRGYSGKAPGEVLRHLSFPDYGFHLISDVLCLILGRHDSFLGFANPSNINASAGKLFYFAQISQTHLPSLRTILKEIIPPPPAVAKFGQKRRPRILKNAIMAYRHLFPQRYL